jgi:ABC-type antimicrobial peptide transport system permease subunit
MAQRTREIGIRRALGAPTGSVVWLVVREGLGPVVRGLAFGLAAAWLAGRAIAARIPTSSSWDTAIFLAAAATLFAAALVASAGPALRAARLTPAQAIRDER